MDRDEFLHLLAEWIEKEAATFDWEPYNEPYREAGTRLVDAALEYVP